MDISLVNMTEIDSQEQKRHFLEFRMGNSFLGCELDHIKEILQINSIPNEEVSAGSVLTLNWRDAEIPLIYLRENLCGRSSERKVWTVVIVESNGLRAGLRVEEVVGVRNLDAPKLRCLPSIIRKNLNFFSKVLITSDHLILILDMGLFLQAVLKTD